MNAIAIQKRILDLIRSNNLLLEGDRVLLAVSGGADSVCLLDVLCQLKQELSLAELHVVHVHHGLRGAEADRDAAYVEALCRDRNLPGTVVYRDVAGYAALQGISIEEAGRILRYEVFSQELARKNLTKIAVAHHQDDKAETILHHLVRGSGLRGLSGIPLMRGQIIRPLLCVDRKEIEHYLVEKNISYCIDSTNEADDYTRNKIRNQWIPLAVSLNPQAVRNICQAGAFIGQADAYLEEQASALLKQYGRQEDTAALCYAEVPAVILRQNAEIIQTYVIRHMVRSCAVGLKDIAATHIFHIRELLYKNTGSHVDLPGGISAEREYQTIRVFREKSEGMERNRLPTLHFRLISAYNAGEIPKNPYTKWFDYDKIKGMLAVRTRKPGDYLTIDGGGRKRLKAYLIDEKIPKRQREELPLLVAEGHVVWVIGYRISEYYKMTEETKSILEVTVDRGEDHGR